MIVRVIAGEAGLGTERENTAWMRRAHQAPAPTRNEEN
jgi:hypothetical protein